MRQLIAALTSQTTYNIKITYFYFLKVIECKYDTDKQESSVLSARILRTEQEPRPVFPVSLSHRCSRTL